MGLIIGIWGQIYTMHVPLGQIAEQPLRLHEEHGTVLSHFNLSLVVARSQSSIIKINTNRSTFYTPRKTWRRDFFSALCL